MFKIREIEIPNRVVLAPMAGVCNAAFRLTAKEFGAGLVCAEMVSDKAILFNNKKALYLVVNYKKYFLHHLYNPKRKHL